MTTPLGAGRPPSAPEGGRPRRIRRSRPRRIAAVIAVAAGLALAATGASALVGARDRIPAYVDRGTLPLPQRAGRAPGTRAAAAPPVRITIARIGLDHGLTGIRVQQDGHLAVPDDPDRVGWWSDGPRPGDPGAAILVGHVDSATGPAAFYGLASLRPGDAITVHRRDGSRVTFTVRALRQYEKDAFPDDQVYATSGPPVLRLITCGGTYDRERGGYRDNVVVYATLARPVPHHPAAPPSTTPHRSGN
ncbi:class F sortase [Streptomyces sp. NPDC051569]|uniref:class F sortase n=1 Tax=Streptomyces sp. NPDC051569 TaxID=3365661 RepID=UPI0037A121C9